MTVTSSAAADRTAEERAGGLAGLAALAVLMLVAYVATVLPTNPAECAAYLQSLGPR